MATAPHGLTVLNLISRRTIATALALLVVAVATAPHAASAQTPGAIVIERPAPGIVQELELRDGSRLFGRVEQVTGDTVEFRTIAGATITVARRDIVSLRAASGRAEGERYVQSDSNRTRLFFGPTARSLPRGTGYVGVYEILLPFVQVGVTDRVSIGGGTPLIFASESTHPVWFTPKVQIHKGERVQAAVGVMHFFNVDDDGGGSLGIAYGVTTIGSDDSAVSIGAGWGYTRDDDADGGGNAAIGMIAAEHRVSRRIKFITENYIFRDGALVAAGVRFIGDRLSADLGLVAPLGVDETFVFPMVNFVWTFGSDR